jgi:arsenite methyltransferase
MRSSASDGAEKDCWATWLARMRSVGDPEVRRTSFEMHAAWRERILDNARLAPGETLLDVGCGEGLVAVGALERGAGQVVFSDISQDVLDRCRFLQAPADNLDGVADGSVDVVTTRSVLIYVADKSAAFREFARVLRPGGRISLLEPINRFAEIPGDTWIGFDFSPIPGIARKLRALYESFQPRDTDPMVDFDERDLLSLAEKAGFYPIHLELEAEIRPSDPVPWDTFVNRAGNPRIPTIGDAMEQVLTEDERVRFTAHLRPLVEEGLGTWRMAMAFVHAVKPQIEGYTGRRGEVAQSVEHTAENRGVAGSIPALAIPGRIMTRRRLQSRALRRSAACAHR